MNPLEREIARQRAALLRIEHNGASDIATTYQRVAERLAENLALLTREIEHARGNGIEVRPGWLFAQQRYHSLIDDLRAETLAFLHRAIATVTNGQAKAVALAPGDATRLTLAALGPGPRSAVAQVKSSFGRLPIRALEQLVGRAGDGEPLGLLLAEIDPASAQAVKDSLAYGVAAGKSPRVIADDVMLRSGMAKTRALAIARTEVLGAYRQASAEQYKQTRIVEQWQWTSVLDARTCAACWAQTGSIHPITEPMATHTNCRCAMTPVVPSWQELGFDLPDNRPQILTGPERFTRLSEADKLAVLGRAKLDAFNEGRITMDDLVRPTDSTRWGKGSRQATLTELGLRV